MPQQPLTPPTVIVAKGAKRWAALSRAEQKHLLTSAQAGIDLLDEVQLVKYGVTPKALAYREKHPTTLTAPLTKKLVIRAFNRIEFKKDQQQERLEREAKETPEQAAKRKAYYASPEWKLLQTNRKKKQRKRREYLRKLEREQAATTNKLEAAPAEYDASGRRKRKPSETIPPVTVINHIQRYDYNGRKLNIRGGALTALELLERDEKAQVIYEQHLAAVETVKRAAVIREAQARILRENHTSKYRDPLTTTLTIQEQIKEDLAVREANPRTKTGKPPAPFIPPRAPVMEGETAQEAVKRAMQAITLRTAPNTPK